MIYDLSVSDINKTTAENGIKEINNHIKIIKDELKKIKKARGQIKKAKNDALN